MINLIPIQKFSALLPCCLAISLYAGVASADVVAVVSARCAITTLSKNQVIDIFLGVDDRTADSLVVVPIDQEVNSPARHEFYLKYANKSPEQIKAHWSKIIFTGRGVPPDQVANSAELKQYLLDNPDTIGYIEREMVDDSLKIVLSQ